MSASKTGYTFLQLALDTLKESCGPLSVDEIWELAVKKGFAAKIESQGKTPNATLGARIYIDIRDNPNSKIVKVSTRPTKFSLKDKEQKTIQVCQNSEKTSEIKPVKAPKIPYKEIAPFVGYLCQC